MQQAGDPGGSGVSTDTVLVRAPKTLERRTVESVIVLGDRVPIVLRGTGIAIWEAFAQPCAFGAAVAALAARYDADVDTVRRETLPVVEHLLSDGALATRPIASDSTTAGTER